MNDGQAQLLSQMFAATGIGDPVPANEDPTHSTENTSQHIQPQDNCVFLIHSDLSTFE